MEPYTYRITFSEVSITTLVLIFNQIHLVTTTKQGALVITLYGTEDIHTSCLDTTCCINIQNTKHPRKFSSSWIERANAIELRNVRSPWCHDGCSGINKINQNDFVWRYMEYYRALYLQIWSCVDPHLPKALMMLDPPTLDEA